MTVALALDLGGTKIEAALVDAEGTLLPQSRHRAPTGADVDPEGLRTAIGAVVRGALAATDARTVAGVGVGSAGPLSPEAGSISPLNMPALAGFPLRDAVRDVLPAAAGDLEVRVALDGACIAVAEQWLGAGRDAHTMLGMVVSTGIGGGIVSQGHVYAGGTGNAGHLGQIAVAGFAPDDASGADVTVERIASGPNIVRWAQQQGWPGRTGEDLAAGYRDGDPLAVAAVRRSAAAVGQALASAGALLDIDVVVIGGGFSRVAADYVELVRTARDEVAAFPFLARARIVPAQLGDESPLIGAGALALRP
jgi:glucokinase